MTWIVIGISGVTCSGKTTLSRRIQEKYKNSQVINQDDYFYLDDSPHHVKVVNMDHNNYELLSSLNMEKMHSDIVQAISTNTEDKKILILEGFTILNYKPIMELCHKKYQIFLDREECWRRRQKRVYDPPDIPGYFDIAVWPIYCEYSEELKYITDINHLDGTRNDLFETITNDIESLL